MSRECWHDKKEINSYDENDTSSAPNSNLSGFYKAQPFVLEESAGSECDDVFSASTPTHGSSASVDTSSKPSRMTKRMAQIQRRLEEVEEKQKELEVRGVTLEKALRGETTEENKEEEELLQEWFELVRERNELRRYEKELLVRAQEMELEDRHARLQQELRDVLAKDECDKTHEEVLHEGALLREMLDTVEKRDALTSLLEQERQRYQEEDKDLEAQVLSKGLRLTPIRKYEYHSEV
ncbi:conserved hypothetical protein [Pediculus humanus corporis]|uniref:BMERB domain-containing protein n=1 Tax=Pediculus humanus subsp. corporis TaxID=121224 RepID=E0VEE7_PEDHC|nr:uncharacterized protein Phum_PHUM131550 [Pediculus humanus corporis]EEB11753.1 conserved hypothetical protein [Pediculus humanus corporis]